MSYLLLFVGWGVFYASHTYLAKLTVKRTIKSRMGTAYRWYRLLYSGLSVFLLFIIMLYAGSIPPVYLWAISPSSTYLGYMLATFGTILAVKALKGMSVSRFVGLTPSDDLANHDTLKVDGLYRWMRHPLYAGLILIFLGYFLYLPTWSSLVHLMALFSYLPFGIHYEEKKLLEIYGTSYREYQRQVPALFPTKKP
ncbi:MAG: isoprenylcysteine carboxylmethyltransferase family protein [Lunatimonas sp.]|uniref:methyltransferase family protein n=1 Tax=Lunatimonas sp. TaxID=2060141 RepID=UPI00263B087A|nr:isoprenylcysteine carboxylmethyltransferase family protein [Lunatimonas sp.]MCC5937553.1 isoprenylcysteine carboxylmethyltransferase family protein [Lunatimonas sp.]